MERDEQEVRDEFAGLAMQALVASQEYGTLLADDGNVGELDNDLIRSCAAAAYELAGAMIARRKRIMEDDRTPKLGE